MDGVNWTKKKKMAVGLSFWLSLTEEAVIWGVGVEESLEWGRGAGAGWSSKQRSRTELCLRCSTKAEQARG